MAGDKDRILDPGKVWDLYVVADLMVGDPYIAANCDHDSHHKNGYSHNTRESLVDNKSDISK